MTEVHRIDINCDMGESFGHYQLGQDEALLSYITSANIACGFHAGDPNIMRKTVQIALEKNVAIGAHPSLQDLVGFGRREMSISPAEAYNLVVYQVGALQAFVVAEGGELQHVKPHGALFNMAAKNKRLAEAIANAVYDINPELILFGLAGSKSIEAATAIGLRSANEVFADRTYQEDGSLTSRLAPHALIHDPQLAINQVKQMIKENRVTTVSGKTIPIKADTICLHGDSKSALQFAKQIYSALRDEEMAIIKAGDFL